MMCFRNFLVAKNFRDMKEREYQNFRSKLFCLTLPKSFVEERFILSLVSDIEKKIKLQRVISQFSTKLFCLTVPKHSEEEPFFALFQKISGSEKVYG